MLFGVPLNDNKKLETVVKRAEEDKELEAYMKASNIMAIDRLGYSDHGPTHIKIVTNIALRLLRMLTEAGVKPSAVEDYDLKEEDAEVIVFLASAMHDIGHAVHREHHEDFSIPLALPILERTLEGIYTTEEKTIIKSETLHAIIAHQRGIQPLTLEAGIIRVSDALDMKKGRARIPFQAGEVNIHSVSALAVEDVKIKKGTEKPIVVEITLSNSSGIFQIDEMLKKKMEGTELKKYMSIKVRIEGENEKKIIADFEL
jgi:hypothetical protein